jgi:OOP family OmpA-OmpF porin
MTRSLACLVLLGAGLALVGPRPVVAQTDPAAKALIDRLKPSSSSATRGIRLPSTPPPAADSAAAAPATAAPTAAAPTQAPAASAAPAAPPRPRDTTADAPSVSITVTFATGSAELTADAKRSLAPLGRALASPDLAPYRFRIEGHTDTVGEASRNQALSERRAAAVRDHLSQTYGVSAVRLEAAGFGASQLLVPTPPQTPEARNRRVQVVNIGS